MKYEQNSVINWALKDVYLSNKECLKNTNLAMKTIHPCFSLKTKIACFHSQSYHSF